MRDRKPKPEPGDDRREQPTDVEQTAAEQRASSSAAQQSAEHSTPGDESWQWDDELWSGSTSAPSHPLDVPERGDAHDGSSASLRRLMRWASRRA